MSQDNPRKFVGRAIALDPATGQDSEYSAYVCVLLTGEAGIPSVNVCQAPTFDELMAKLKRDEILPHFAKAKFTFEPPRTKPFVSHSMARQRYEALPYAELNMAQTILSGR